MQKITPKQYAISLYESVRDVDKEKIPQLIESFVSLIAKNKDLKKADKIIKAFRKYLCEQENIIEVAVVAAKPLDDQVRQKIIDQLKSSLNKTVELKEEQDTSLIGGAVLKYGDVVVDGSIKRRVELLTDSLK